MHIKLFGQRMSENVLTEIIISVIFGLIMVGAFISSPIYYTVSSAGFFCFYTIWVIMSLRAHAKRVSRKSTYFWTNGIVFAALAIPGVILAAAGAKPYYYFLFYPFAALEFAGVCNLLVSTLITNGILLLCYLICPFTVKRKKHRRHRHRHGDNGPVDTNNFIMKV